ncbi:hypothetical protein HCN44_010803 [Aphidius gifuensis]|uniref:Uncharacterized protein n=1 Tax=Aphidius gifuensis TaxID=684658 RepID=A0A835CU77_APHGI|nr:hypothetical protein HCN44_010803 [Aphidius gifuensis]
MYDAMLKILDKIIFYLNHIVDASNKSEIGKNSEPNSDHKLVDELKQSQNIIRKPMMKLNLNVADGSTIFKKQTLENSSYDQSEHFNVAHTPEISYSCVNKRLKTESSILNTCEKSNQKLNETNTVINGKVLRVRIDKIPLQSTTRRTRSSYYDKTKAHPSIPGYEKAIKSDKINGRRKKSNINNFKENDKSEMKKIIPVEKYIKSENIVTKNLENKKTDRLKIEVKQEEPQEEDESKEDNNWVYNKCIEYKKNIKGITNILFKKWQRDDEIEVKLNDKSQVNTRSWTSWFNGSK